MTDKKATDKTLVNYARRIDRHNQAVLDLMQEIEALDHPNVQAFIDELESNSMAIFASAECLVYRHLMRPGY